MVEDTIVAIATPPGKAGVAIVRISGSLSLEILKNITKSCNDFSARYMYLKDIYVDTIIDDALVVYFKSPNSFTGEDVAEIQCHGGYFLAEQVVKEVIKLGARMAQPGEFSKRAFLNGKMSVDQAEGIMDIINAESLAQAKAGSELIKGDLYKIVTELQSKLTDVIASVEAKLDYPEYDFDKKETNDMKNNLNNLKTELENLSNSHIKGSLIKNGVKVAIVGEPNVGKSSLLNALTHSNKAIVTEIAGTTRDVIEGEYVYNGIVFRLFDTAGIHESNDKVEKIGIERALDSVKSADIILKLQEVGKVFQLNTYSKPIINVFTKADLYNDIQDNNKGIYISSVKNQNIEELKELIFNIVLVDGYDSSQFYITNTRHSENIKDALVALNRAIQGIDNMSLDFVVSDLNICWQKIGEITGITSNEEIIDRIFKKFCLGK